MSGNGCTHYNTTNHDEQRFNSQTQEWETWEVSVCDNAGCRAVTAESKKS